MHARSLLYGWRRKQRVFWRRYISVLTYGVLFLTFRNDEYIRARQWIRCIGLLIIGHLKSDGHARRDKGEVSGFFLFFMSRAQGRVMQRPSGTRDMKVLKSRHFFLAADYRRAAAHLRSTVRK